MDTANRPQPGPANVGSAETARSCREVNWEPACSLPGQVAQRRGDAGDLQPARADVVVFSNDFANRRERPRRPWATSTRHAWRMGRKTGCLSSHPTRRTSRSWTWLRLLAGAAVTPRSTRTSSSRSATPCWVRCSSVNSLARVLVGRGRNDHRGHRQARHVDGDDTFGALGATVGPTSVVEGEPAVRGSACAVGVDDDHRGRLLRPSVPSARDRVQQRQRLRPHAVAGPTTELATRPGSRPKRLREVAPLAAGLGDVQHRVHHGS
jgi:hypothetical protein